MASKNDGFDYGAFLSATPTRKDMIILAAAATIDYSSCKNLEAAEKILCKRIGTIMGYLREDSIPSRMMDATPLVATVTKIEPDPNPECHRLVISFISETGNQGQDPQVETVRSDWIHDNAYGEKIRKMWTGLENKRVVIYKCNEPTGDPKKPTIRVAPYVKVIG